MTTTELEVHVMRPLPLPLWPDDDGPYWDESAYQQIVLTDPTLHELARLGRYLRHKRDAGYVIEHYWSSHPIL